MRYSGIKDAQVVGVYDEDYGEEIKACVITDGSISEDDIRQYMKSNYARHKIPKYIEIVEKFPTNAAGKVLKYKLKNKR